MIDSVPVSSGTYLLFLYCENAVEIQVGKLGLFEFQPGYYHYIGSAFGSGGLKARIGHHNRISQSPHWHLDYIRPNLVLTDIWYSLDNIRHEHAWAECLYYTLGLQIPVAGLGSSDCQCRSHFLYSDTKLEICTLRKIFSNTTKNIEIINLL